MVITVSKINQRNYYNIKIYKSTCMLGAINYRKIVINCFFFFLSIDSTIQYIIIE